jgi:hypothetical protein
VLTGSVIVGASGLVLIGFSSTLPFAALAGGLIATGRGSFHSVNWALMNAVFPQGTYQVSFGLAGGVAAFSIMPRRRIAS